MPVEGGAHGAAAVVAQDYEPFHEQWRELMRRASSLQATMQKFALELASAPSSSSGGKMRRKMGGGSTRGRALVEAEEVTRARAIGKALLSVSM